MRDRDLYAFFSHVNKSYKTSLSGLSQSQTYFPVLKNVYDSHIVLDGPVIAHLLKPIGTDTFEDVINKSFLCYVASQRSSRIEVILWDISLPVLIFLLQRVSQN